MDVGAEHALDDNEAADVHVLTDGEDHILELAFNGEVGVKILESKKSFNICGLVAENSRENTLYELLESVVLCNKVGLRVDLDHCGGVFVIGKKDIDNTFGCDTVSLLCGYGKALLTKNLYSLVEISARLGESLLALHHAAAGLGAEIGYHFCSNCSHLYLPFLFFDFEI